MEANSHDLTQLLSLAALIGGTIEYAEIIKRRGISRRANAFREESADLGLRGLVRVLLVENEQEPAVVEPEA